MREVLLTSLLYRNPHFIDEETEAQITQLESVRSGIGLEAGCC